MGPRRLGFCQSRWRRRRRRPCSYRVRGLWRLGPACRTRSRLGLGLREPVRRVRGWDRRSAFWLARCSGWRRRNPWIPRANVPPFFTICYCIVLLVFAGLCETSCGFSSVSQNGTCFVLYQNWGATNMLYYKSFRWVEE